MSFLALYVNIVNVLVQQKSHLFEILEMSLINILSSNMCLHLFHENDVYWRGVLQKKTSIVFTKHRQLCIPTIPSRQLI